MWRKGWHRLENRQQLLLPSLRLCGPSFEVNNIFYDDLDDPCRMLLYRVVSLDEESGIYVVSRGPVLITFYKVTQSLTKLIPKHRQNRKAMAPFRSSLAVKAPRASTEAVQDTTLSPPRESLESQSPKKRAERWCLRNARQSPTITSETVSKQTSTMSLAGCSNK
jgi:hypothetical protein